MIRAETTEYIQAILTLNEMCGNIGIGGFSPPKTRVLPKSPFNITLNSILPFYVFFVTLHCYSTIDWVSGKASGL